MNRLTPVEHWAMRWVDRYVPCLKPPRLFPGWTVSHYRIAPQTRLWRFRNERWQAAKQPFKARLSGNTKIWIQPGEEISASVYIGGCYEPNQMRILFRMLAPGMVFMDVGAHDGVYTLCAASLVGSKGRVIALEPSQREFEHLQANLSANRFQNVSAYRAAAYSSDGETRLNVAEPFYSGHNTTSNFIYQTTKFHSAESVPAYTLDSIAKKEHLDTVDILKIDVEGAEPHVLTGSQELLQKHRPVLFVEIVSASKDAPSQSDVPNVWEFLISRGYRLFAFDLETGEPFACASHPGSPHSDFIAVPSHPRPALAGALTRAHLS